MDLLPCPAEFVEFRCERLFEPIDFLQRETEVAAGRGRTSRAVQVEEGFFARAENVNVCRAMIVGVDDHPSTGHPKPPTRLFVSDDLQIRKVKLHAFEKRVINVYCSSYNEHRI